MKTKNKMLTMLEIAIVLCSVFLVATLPAIAAEQTMQKTSANTITTASEDDFVLGIYGNANEDDTIDMRDLTYVKLIFFGKKPETELADAKYDGKINPLDFIQIKLIIVGKEKELTIVDSARTSDPNIVTVKKPIKRIVCNYRFALETLRSLKVPKDIIVGVPCYYSKGFELYFPEYDDVSRVGNIWNPDIEAILNLNPDVIFFHPKAGLDATQDVLDSAGITVLRFNCGVSSGYILGGYDIYPREIKVLGYLLDKEDEAEEFIDWYEGVVYPIIEKAAKIPEKDKPKVYYESSYDLSKPYYTSSVPHIEMAGGKTIFETGGEIDPEAIMVRNPDIIVKKLSSYVVGEEVCGYHLDADDTTYLEKVKGEIMSRPELRNVKAVKNGRVYIISGYITAGGPDSGPRNFLQLAYFARWFHSELFSDLDPKAIHQEYLIRFQRLDIDLDEKGVFVYPKPE